MIRHALPLAAGVAICAASVSHAPARAASDLYQAAAIVTGEAETERARGFARCLEDVLVKVSGDPRLLGDARMTALAARAADFVAEFHYQDRMRTVPQTHEQGTRDRPFDLFVTFDEARIDAALLSVGSAPWTSPRPRLAVLLGIADATTRYVLAIDGERGEGQRQSLAAAAAKRGLPIVLPRSHDLAADGVTYDVLVKSERAPIESAAKDAGGEVALVGTLVWNEAIPGWTADWHLAKQGKDVHWRKSDTSFDDAFRHAIEGAEQILSNNGTPR
jgi:uncharacterized protein